MHKHLRSFGVYALTAALTFLLFIVLHLVGNRLPFDLAVERLADEFAATPFKDWGMRGGIDTDIYMFCEMSAAVVAGAKATRDEEHNMGAALRSAFLLRTLPGRPCDTLKAGVLEDAWSESPGLANSRYWLGGKALYAIALRHLTVHEFHLLIKTLIYCAFLLLALALLRIGWRALVVGAPLLAFGLCFSAVERYWNVADGLPFAWALLAPALGAVLLWRGSSASAVRVFFFFAGMVSQYLWFFDGGNFLAATLVGIVVWLACEQGRRGRSVRYAASCVGVYAAGFAVSLVARFVIVSSLDERVALGFETQTKFRWEQILAPRPKDLSGRDFGTFQEVTRTDTPTFEWLMLTAAGALAMAVFIAGRWAWRRRPAPLLEVLWLVALLLPSCLHFLMPSDDPGRPARLMFLPLAMCCCCLLAVLTRLERRQAAIWIGGVGIATAMLYAGTHFVSHWKYLSKLRHARLLSVAEEESAFAVYLFEPPAGRGEGGREGAGGHPRELVYWKSPCNGGLETAAGLKKEFFLGNGFEANSTEREGRFVPADFRFYEHGQQFLGACGASVLLPNDVRWVHTGQYLPYADGVQVWRREIDLTDRRELVPDGPPAVSAFFDLYLDTERGTLVYSKAPCRVADTAAKFFVHVQPVSRDSLPPHRRQQGFDNLDFDFPDLGMRSPVESGWCVAAVDLPSYPVASVNTGQFDAGPRWEVRIDIAAHKAQDR